MRFYAHERLALLVDGPNIWATGNALSLDIDWAKLQDFFGRQALLCTSIYFTRLAHNPDGFVPHKPLVDFLTFNGWQVVDHDPAVALTIDAMELAYTQIDHFVLATGDGKYAPLAEALKRWGKRVTILSSLKAGSVSEDLRRAADDFLDLDALRETIARPARAPKEAVGV